MDRNWRTQAPGIRIGGLDAKNGELTNKNAREFTKKVPNEKKKAELKKKRNEIKPGRTEIRNVCHPQNPHSFPVSVAFKVQP